MVTTQNLGIVGCCSSELPRHPHSRTMSWSTFPRKAVRTTRSWAIRGPQQASLWGGCEFCGVLRPRLLEPIVRIVQAVTAVRPIPRSRSRDGSGFPADAGPAKRRVHLGPHRYIRHEHSENTAMLRPTSHNGSLARASRTALLMAASCGGIALTGCQVDVGGQTLPSPYYLQDDIQYFPAGPEFKLAKEAAALKAYSDENGGGETYGEPCDDCR
jgi:hypothetical protein